jgi:hypothetical protein
MLAFLKLISVTAVLGLSDIIKHPLVPFLKILPPSENCRSAHYFWSTDLQCFFMFPQDDTKFCNTPLLAMCETVFSSTDKKRVCSNISHKLTPNIRII